LTDIDVMGRLLIATSAARRVHGQRQSQKHTFSRILETFSMWDRFASKIGVERKAKHVPSVVEVMNRDE
jgi:hypothetical protein